MDKCYNCGKKLEETVYMWRGLTPMCCSASCAAHSCPNAELVITSKEDWEKNQ